MIKITVFTPTYNRAHTLPQLYDSLKNQSFQDFEWLIVDDGSTDGTHDLVDEWLKEGRLNIRYQYQLNGGKHRAINLGVSLAKGWWFFIVDSDDTLTINALEVANKWIMSVDADDTLAGVSGLRRINGQIPDVNFDYIDETPLSIKEIIRVDKSEIFRTNVLKKYPFPDISGEKFCAESLIWNRIGLKYKLRYFNEVIYNCEYRQDGLTNKSLEIRRQSPTYASINYCEQMKNMPSWKVRVRAAINYWRFVWMVNDYQIMPTIPNWSYLFLPIGVFFSLRDQILSK